jgi:hypothetical protein
MLLASVHHGEVKVLLFSIGPVDCCTHNAHTPCISTLCTARSNCTAETDSLCSYVAVYSCMSIAAIPIVTNSVCPPSGPVVLTVRPAHSTGGTSHTEWLVL